MVRSISNAARPRAVARISERVQKNSRYGLQWKMNEKIYNSWRKHQTILYVVCSYAYFVVKPVF